MPDEQDTSAPPSPEYQAILDDLKAYDNPEVFEDPDLPQIYKFHIVSTLLQDYPTVIRIEIDGDILPSALVETAFSLISQDPEQVREMCEKHGDKDFAEFRANFENDPRFDDIAYSMWLFFVRNFPKLLLSIYGIGAVSSFMAVMLSMLRQEPDEELNEIEVVCRSTLETIVNGFEKSIKQMVETRPKGRPTKVKASVGSAPEIARRVWKIACEMMGEARGSEAVPVLKEIANALDVSADALGKQLARSGWPWTRIKTDLASRT